MESFLVKGTVASVKRLGRHGTSVTIEQNRHRMEVFFEGYVACYGRDFVSCMCIEKGGKINAISKPIIELSRSDRTIFYALQDACKLPTMKIEEIISTFKMKAKGASLDLFEFLARLSERFVDCGDITALQEIHIPNCSDFLKKWHEKWNLRRLYALGFTKTLIRSVGMGTVELYERVTKNPYTFTMFDEKRVEDIAERVGRPLPQDMTGIMSNGFPEEYREKWFIGNYVLNVLKNGRLSISIQEAESLNEMAHEHIKADDIGDYGLHVDFERGHVEPICVYKDSMFVVDFFRNLLLEGSAPGVTDTFVVSITEAGFLCAEQVSAIVGACCAPLAVITGPAGSGKTTLTRYLLNFFRESKNPMLACSQTGKAVCNINRMAGEKIGFTIHKLLHNPDLYEEFTGTLIIDEATMVGLPLFARLLRALGSRIKHLVLIGDVNQLAAIEHGEVFAELIKTSRAPIYSLKETHRSRAHSGCEDGILANARNILEMDNMVFFPYENFQIVEGDIKTIKNVIRMLRDRGVNPSKVKILSPYREPINKINSMFQKIFFSSEKAFTDVDGNLWHEKDVVMCQKNSSACCGGIFNGQEGVIEKLDKLEGIPTAWIKMEGAPKALPVPYPLVPLKRNTYENKEEENSGDEECSADDMRLFVLGYCTTVHKSQGSEWDTVIGYVPSRERVGSFLDKNKLYTLITRAVRACWLVGCTRTIQMWASNKRYVRNNILRERVKDSLPLINLEANIEHEEEEYDEWADYDLDDY